MKRFYCTYFDRNYLPKALAMIESLVRSDNCQVKIFAVCMDEITRIALNRINMPNVVPIPLHAIEDGDTALLKTKQERTTIEYYWTTTPTIILRIMEKYPEIDILTYLDADLFFFSDPQKIFDELGNGDVLIHEHRYSPALAYLERDNGRFNVGLLSFRNNQNGLNVLRWWRERCLEWCYWRSEDGKMGDQMYLNDWPVRFMNVVILQVVGAGVAPWNHDGYQIDEDSYGNIFAENQPLIFYHFHSFSFLGEAYFSPHHSHYGVNIEALRRCFLVYHKTMINWVRQVENIFSGFSFGVTKTSDLQEGSLIACSNENGFQGQRQNMIDDQWTLIKSQKQFQPIAHQPSKRENIKTSMPLEALIWPEGKAVDSPNDLILALGGRPVCEDIRILFVVGAFKFEEETLFNVIFPNLQRIILAEPIPYLAEALSRRFAGRKNIDVLPYAISDTDGKTNFFVTNNLQSSSLLTMGHHSDLFQQVKKTQTIEVECRKISTVIEQHNIPAPDMLFIDAQGAELRILKAVPRNLRRKIKLIYAEASTIELYVDSGTLSDIQQELAPAFLFAGYAPTHNDIPVHGNAIFVNQHVTELIRSETYTENTTALDKDFKIKRELIDTNELFKAYPNDATIMMKMAHLLKVVGKVKEAAVFLRLMLNQNPGHVKTRKKLSELIDLMIKCGDNVSARDCCLAVLAVDPDNKEILEKWESLKDHQDAKRIIEILPCSPKEYRVSAIVSTYKSEEFIGECLENLMNQSIAEQIEIVIIDAASPQNEKLVVAKYREKYSNIKYIRTNERIGVYAAWNIAIQHSTAPYCISVSTNDQLSPDTCKILADELDADAEIMLVFGDTYLTKYPHETFGNNRHHAVYQWPAYSFQRHLENGCCIGPHPMWRRAIHQQVGYFDERFIADGDQELWMRIGSKYKIRHIDSFTGLQWLTEESLSGKGETPLLELAYIQARYR
jgi:FkbM family methyltransferase